MRLTLDDIPDSKVRSWAIAHTSDERSWDIDPIHYIRVDDLVSDFERSFLELYQHYRETKNLATKGGYFAFLKRHQNNPRSRTDFSLMSQDEIRRSTLARLRMVDDMIRNGFREDRPIRLYKYRFMKPRYRVISKDKRSLEFSGFDGHHRVAAAKFVNMEYIPAVIQNRTENFDRLLSKKWRWYQPLDVDIEGLEFDHPRNNLHGSLKYQFILRDCLEPIQGRVFCDFGCNTGVISASIAADNAEFVLGIDRKSMIKQAQVVKQVLWKDYGNLSFHPLDLRDLQATHEVMTLAGKIDCVLMSNFVYYLGDSTDGILDLCRKFAKRIVLQGNRLKLQNGIESRRIDKLPDYRGEYASIKGMVDLLHRHGYKTKIVAPDNYPKPVVVGTL